MGLSQRDDKYYSARHAASEFFSEKKLIINWDSQKKGHSQRKHLFPVTIPILNVNEHF